MIKIESIKDYINNISETNIIELAIKIYMITNLISNDYPNYENWFFTKQLPETINSDDRNILFVRNPNNYSEIIAIACLKKEEKKICTLYVTNEYRHLGIGNKLVKESMKWLDTTKPLITIPYYKLEMYKSIIIKYDWKLTEIISNIYNYKSYELCFNSSLTKNNNKILKKD